MNILLFTTDFPQPSDWTRAPFNLHLCSALAAAHRVSVVVPCSWYERVKARTDRDRAPRLDLPRNLSVEYATFYYTPGIFRWSHEALMWLSTRAAIQRAVARAKPDAVVGYWAFPDGAVASRIARQLQVPFVQMVGGSDVLTCGSGARRDRVARVLRSADRVVAVGHHLSEAILGLGVEPSRVSVVPRGVDTALFSKGSMSEARRRLDIQPEGVVLLWVGRLVPVKGLDTLLDASAELVRAGVEHRLLLVGDGPLEGELRQKAAALGVNVEFRPAVQQGELPDYYRAANVTLLSSRSEGIPNVLRESMACGTPFVSTRVGGIPEIAREGIDELVPAQEPASFARAVIKVLKRGGREPQARAVCLSWADSAQKLVDVISGADREARIA